MHRYAEANYPPRTQFGDKEEVNLAREEVDHRQGITCPDIFAMSVARRQISLYPVLYHFTCITGILDFRLGSVQINLKPADYV